jgi:hypothetical protein
LKKLHTEIYAELSELSSGMTSTDLKCLAESSIGETTYSYFDFVYKVAHREGTIILKNFPSVINVSDDGYVITNIINIVGQQRAQFSGAIAECIYTFDKVLAHKIANYVWFNSGTVNQKVILMILSNLYMGSMSLTNLYVEPQKNAIDELISSFDKSKISSNQITIPPEIMPLQAPKLNEIIVNHINHVNPVNSVNPVNPVAKTTLADAELDETLRALAL